MNLAPGSFGVVLRQARQARGMTLATLAAKMRLSVQYLCDLELGRRAPLAGEHLRQAANILDLDEETLVKGAVISMGRAEILLPESSAGRGFLAHLYVNAHLLPDEAWENLLITLCTHTVFTGRP